MTPLNRPLRHHTTANGTGRAALSSACQARIQLISDGVVASYIHDISARQHTPRPTSNRTPSRRP